MDEDNKFKPWTVVNTELQSNQKLREKKLKSAKINDKSK